MRLRRAALVGLLLALHRPLCAAVPPPAVTVAVADFGVTGLGEPRYWLGPLYAEVLARRLLLSNAVVVVEPLRVRQRPASAALLGVDQVTERCLALSKSLPASYVIGGLLDDQGTVIKVTAVIAAATGGRTIALSADTTYDKLYQPQNDLVVRRFLPNTGARPLPAEVQAMEAFDPKLTPQLAELVGKGWRAYAPDAPEDSFKLWRQALRLDANCVLASEALAGAGYLYRRMLLDRSLAFYEQQSAVESTNPLAHFHLAEIYSDLGRWRDAEKQYREAMRLRNTFVEAYLGLAVASIQQSLYDQALIVCEGGLKLSPDHIKLLHNKAVALYQRGLLADAKATWARILQLDPNDELAKQRAQLYSRGSSPLDDRRP